MREVNVDKIRQAVSKLCMEANYYLPPDVENALKEGCHREESPIGKDIFAQLLENLEIARREKIPLCQDTGIAVVFVQVGQEVALVGGDVQDAVNQGVREGYTKGYLRKSVITDPLFERTNTKDNTPCIVHIRLVPGDKIKIQVAPKGAGSENMSRLAMLKPADAVEGVKRFVVNAVKKAGPNPCPPVVVGVGVGGDFEYAAFLAKKALLRKIGEHNPDPRYAKLEEELLSRINNTGVGPQGLGGKTTALAANVEWFPCHIASLPVAVNIQCHAARHKEMQI